VRASRADVRYLLDAANWFFPTADLHDGDVVSAWAEFDHSSRRRGDSGRVVARARDSIEQARRRVDHRR
jgi:hypothetical protein